MDLYSQIIFTNPHILLLNVQLVISILLEKNRSGDATDDTCSNNPNKALYVHTLPKSLFKTANEVKKAFIDEY